VKSCQFGCLETRDPGTDISEHLTQSFVNRYEASAAAVCPPAQLCPSTEGARG
jgi:hypothetical protein